MAPCSRIGPPPTSVAGATGVQGPVGTGTHGIGVSTPNAAAVAVYEAWRQLGFAEGI